jgi:small subunit ribosomal protein S9e
VVPLLLLPPSRYGLLNETQDKLDYVLALSPQDFLERRLQTLVFKQVCHSTAQHAALAHVLPSRRAGRETAQRGTA